MAKDFPILIFADGASSGNPGPGGWGAIIASPQGIVLELGGKATQTTNNKMELMAAIQALERPEAQVDTVRLYTDSTYVIRGITQWIWAWRKNEWKTSEGKEVTNQDLWKRLSAVIAKRDKKCSVAWKYVRGHSGVPGNERVDEIAVEFSKGRRPALFHGPILKYPIPIHDLPEDEPLPEMSPKKPKPAPAYSYLSLIGSIPMRHPDWPDCEKRVKGRSGAKFKKAKDEAEEREILRSWGVDPGLFKKK